MGEPRTFPNVLVLSIIKAKIKLRGARAMTNADLILNADRQLAFEEISAYINEPALGWWNRLNSFIQDRFNMSPKLSYSKCSMQKGWNVKYNRSSKSLCTLYPEKENFIVLIVIKLELADIIASIDNIFEPVILNIIESARPFNGTKWLMIPISNEAILNNVQELLIMKYDSISGKKAK